MRFQQQESVNLHLQTVAAANTGVFASLKRTFQQQPAVRVRLKCIGGTVALLALWLGVCVFPELQRVRQLSLETSVSQAYIIGNNLQRDIERALFFGKSVEKFVGIERLLENTKRSIVQKIVKDRGAALNDAISVSLVSLAGSILYSTEKKLVGTMLPEAFTIADASKRETSLRSTYGTVLDGYLIPIVIHDSSKKQAATALIAFPRTPSSASLSPTLKKHIIWIGIILCASLFLLFPVFQVVIPTTYQGSRFPKMTFVSVTLIFMLLSQMALSAAASHTFAMSYRQSKREKARMLTALLKEDIEHLLRMNVPIHQLTNVATLMKEAIAEFPEVQSMTILNAEKMPLYVATQQKMLNVQQAADDQLKELYAAMPVLERSHNSCCELMSEDTLKGFLCVNLSKETL